MLCDEHHDSDSDKCSALQKTEERIFFEARVMKWWAESGEGGSRASELGSGEMIGGWRAEANVGQMYQSASVALLLKIIYQRVSGFDVMDIARLD